MRRLALAAICLLLPSCVIVIDEDFRGHLGSGKLGSGQRSEVHRKTESFHALEFRGAGDLEIQVGTESSLRLSADDNLIAGVTTKVHNGTLVIDYPNNYRFDEDLVVTVGIPSLDSVRVLGSGNVQIRSAQGSSLYLGISGSGSIQASGSTNELEAKISGSGELRLSSLHADCAEVVISGSGDAQLHVARELRYSISGSGNIQYSGAANAHGSVSGSGRLSRN